MTDFKPYPDRTVSFPEGSKVTGDVRIFFRGNGNMGMMTEGGQRLTFRGDDSYTLHLNLQHDNETGRVVVRDDYIYLKRGLWADVPKTYAAAIIRAAEDLATAEWSDLQDRVGLEADVAQRLHSLERQYDEQAAALDKTMAEIREQRERLES